MNKQFFPPLQRTGVLSAPLLTCWKVVVGSEKQINHVIYVNKNRHRLSIVSLYGVLTKQSSDLCGALGSMEHCPSSETNSSSTTEIFLTYYGSPQFVNMFTEPAPSPYLDLDQFSPQTPLLILGKIFNIILLTTSRSSK